MTTRPRDVRLGEDRRPILLWRRRKWRCRVDGCEWKVSTECLPEQIPARITTRARRLTAEAIGDHTRPVSGVAAEFGMDWRVAQEAFVAHAAVVLPEAPTPVTVLRVDETRRGKEHYEADTATGEKAWVDRFDTGLVNLSGDSGLFAQINGRTSKGPHRVVAGAGSGHHSCSECP